MSLNEILTRSVYTLFFLAPAHAKTLDLCPDRLQDPIQQIYLFDGLPEDQAYLAPDNDTTAANLYSLKAIYDKGRFVTARCKYQGGSILDIELRKPLAKCTFREGKASYGNFRCR